VYSESKTELKIPDLEPEAIYEMKGEDILTLYQTVNDLMPISQNALELAKEYERENQKLQLQNNFLIGGITVSVGVVVVGAVLFTFTNIK
jgi:hypothetical protein